jgi:hypothetical protein
MPVGARCAGGWSQGKSGKSGGAGGGGYSVNRGAHYEIGKLKWLAVYRCESAQA